MSPYWQVDVATEGDGSGDPQRVEECADLLDIANDMALGEDE